MQTTFLVVKKTCVWTHCTTNTFASRQSFRSYTLLPQDRCSLKICPDIEGVELSPPSGKPQAQVTMSQASSVPFAIDTHVTQALSVIEDNVAPQPDSLSIIPIAFSYHSTVPKPKDIKALKNSQIPVFANEVVKTAWVFNGVNNGHSISTMATKNFRADIVLAVAADPSPSGRAMLKQFTSCPVIQDLTKGLLNVIASATTKSSVHCYFFHSRQFELPKTDQAFWLEQVQLIRLLRIKRQLIAFGGFVHPSCDLSFVEKFSRILHHDK